MTFGFLEDSLPFGRGNPIIGQPALDLLITVNVDGSYHSAPEHKLAFLFFCD
jgi:hypothetical protein